MKLSSVVNLKPCHDRDEARWERALLGDGGGDGPLLRPAAGHDPASLDANRLDRVDPGDGESENP